MGYIEIYDVVLHFNLAQSNAFAPIPISMLNLLHISIDRPMMEESLHNAMFREHAKARSKHSRVEIMRVWIKCRYTKFDFVKIIIAPNFLQCDDVVATLLNSFGNVWKFLLLYLRYYLFLLLMFHSRSTRMFLSFEIIGMPQMLSVRTDSVRAIMLH